MSNEPEYPRSEWDPLGWELEAPEEPSSNLPKPRAVEVVAWVPRDNPPPQSRNPVVIMLVASVLLAVLGLVGIGIGIGSIFFNQDSPPPEVVVVSGPQVVSTLPDQPVSPSAPLVPAPSENADISFQHMTGEEPVVNVARTVLPSVVHIEIDDFAQGSGIIYDPSGLILTNAHVAGGVEHVEVVLSDGTRKEGTVVGAVWGVDVALIRIDSDVKLSPATFADLSTVEVGQLAVAVGSPFGLEQTVTSGVVSAIGRVEHIEDFGLVVEVELIQTDAPINVGNSGGALVDINGRVIGMNTFIQTDGSIGNIGIGFAIPADIAIEYAERILDGRLGRLGISIGPSGADNLGVYVVDVEKNSPAEDSDLLEGDIIVSIDREELNSTMELVAQVQSRLPGTVVELEVIRDGEPVKLFATLTSSTSHR